MPRAWRFKDAIQMGWITLAILTTMIWPRPTEGQGPSEFPEELKGIVVEEVGKHSALEKAGLRPGDVLYSWKRLPAPPANPEPAEGIFESVFDWMELEIEQAPRGVVRLVGERDGEEVILEVRPGEWEATLRPRMSAEMLADYLKGEKLIDEERIEAGLARWHKMVQTVYYQTEDGNSKSWLSLKIGKTWSTAREWEKTQIVYGSALRSTRNPFAKALIWRALGTCYKSASDFNMAREAYNSGLETQKGIQGKSLIVANFLNDLGSLDWRQGKLDSAQDYWQRALKIRQELAPGSLDEAASLSNLGLVATDRGDFNQATGYHEEALEIRQRLAPDSLGVANSFNNLGNVARLLGDLTKAAEYYERDLQITQRLAPGSLAVAVVLNNLGVLATDRGDLDRGADYYERDLEITNKLAPNSLDMATCLNNLGVLSGYRGKWDRALKYHTTALEIRERLAPDSIDVAISQRNLGNVAYSQGDLEKAIDYYKKTLAIIEDLAPNSIDAAMALGNLGNLARDRGDLSQAGKYYEKTLETISDLAPGSIAMAGVLNNLGLLAADHNQLNQAVEYHEAALKILRRLAPASSEEANVLYTLANIRRIQKRSREALNLFYKALEALENQIKRFGRTQNLQANFRAERVDYYRDTIALLVESHQETNAFHVLERSRAQTFLTQLAERDIVFSDFPEKIEERRRQIGRKYDQTQNEIAKLNVQQQGDRIEILLGRLQELRWDYQDITEKIVGASPKLGTLRYPQPLDLEAALQALDPGTVMLSYSVDESQTHLFILDREDRLRVETLAIGEKKLRIEVEKILELQKWHAVPALYTEPLRQAGERLYKALIQPAEESIAKSDRILIVPDGPLHLLPFALLVRKTGPGKRDFDYFVEWKPLHSVLSATVYSELKKQRRSKSEESQHAITLAAFGDPKFPAASYGDTYAEVRDLDVYVRAAAERGFDFRPLPYSREEVNRVVALYPEGDAQAYLGAEASEERAKAIGKSTRILHFATHGRYDHRIPLNSYVALTIPRELREGQENGLLQAWEIYEDVRLDADLVVLSACESGLGDELATEGLIGLTRAFQFAGARTVASSLWQVEDWATAELMERLYRHLRSGKTKDEALRAAQLELIRGPVETVDREGRVVTRDLSSPYYWAAFQMIGDWQ